MTSRRVLQQFVPAILETSDLRQGLRLTILRFYIPFTNTVQVVSLDQRSESRLLFLRNRSHPTVKATTVELLPQVYSYSVSWGIRGEGGGRRWRDGAISMTFPSKATQVIPAMRCE